MDYEHVDEGHGLALPSSGPPHPVVFEPLPVAAIADEDVAGAYSRDAWFEVVGPAAWLSWGHIARRLRGQAEVEWTLEELGDISALPVEAVAWGLLQLTRHGLANGVGDHRWRVQTVCPPLRGTLAAGVSDGTRRRRHGGVPRTPANEMAAAIRFGRRSPFRRTGSGVGATPVVDGVELVETDIVQFGLWPGEPRDPYSAYRFGGAGRKRSC